MCNGTEMSYCFTNFSLFKAMVKHLGMSEKIGLRVVQVKGNLCKKSNNVCMCVWSICYVNSCWTVLALIKKDLC